MMRATGLMETRADGVPARHLLGAVVDGDGTPRGAANRPNTVRAYVVTDLRKHCVIVPVSSAEPPPVSPETL